MLGEVLQRIKTLSLGVFAIFTKQVLMDSVSGLLTITLVLNFGNEESTRINPLQ
jgi:hypothetical protein